jgi:hypothetical protein
LDKISSRMSLADVPGGDGRQPLAVYVLACQTGPTGGLSEPETHSRTIARPSQYPGRVRHQYIDGGKHRRAKSGSKFATITDSVASLLDGVTTKGAASSKPQPNDAFLTLVGHCVDGYLIKIHGSEISSQ